MAATEPATGVICKRCQKPVEVKTAERVSDEFSVCCPKCGRRDFYRIKDIKTLRQ
jgi:RNase P subunit RPR2